MLPSHIIDSVFFQGLTACDADGVRGTTSLPKYIKPLGPYNSDATIIQSLATALHVSSQPITGKIKTAKFLRSLTLT